MFILLFLFVFLFFFFFTLFFFFFIFPSFFFASSALYILLFLFLYFFFFFVRRRPLALPLVRRTTQENETNEPGTKTTAQKNQMTKGCGPKITGVDAAMLWGPRGSSIAEARAGTLQKCRHLYRAVKL